jgi:hypothetical protein
LTALRAQGADRALHCGTPGDVQDERRDEHDSSRHPSETVRRRRQDSLVLDATPTQARATWLMHVLQARQA